MVGHQPTVHNPILRQQAKDKFLTGLAEGYSVGGAADAAGIDRSTAYAWRDSDPVFAAAWSQFWERGSDWYEDKLRTKADKLDTVAIIVGLKMRGRFVEKGLQADPEQLAQAIVASLRQLAAEQRRLSQPQIAEPAQPDRAVDISSIVRSDTPDSHSQQSS